MPKQILLMNAQLERLVPKKGIKMKTYLTCCILAMLVPLLLSLPLDFQVWFVGGLLYLILGWVLVDEYQWGKKIRNRGQ